MHLRFTTNSGTEFQITGTKRMVPDKFGIEGSAIDIQFKTSHGDMGLTGRGEAFQVFSSVVPAVTALIQKEDPDFITFTAAEASRQKLYDRLVKVTAGVSKDKYFARTFTGPYFREYMIGKLEHKAKFEEYIKKSQTSLTQGAIVNAVENAEPSEDRWESITPEVNPDWFTEEGWEDDSEETETATKNAAEGGVWRTIRGARVFIEGGKITKGPANLVGTEDPNSIKAIDKQLNDPENLAAWKVPEKLYHVTTSENAKKILKGGLKIKPKTSETGDQLGVYLTDDPIEVRDHQDLGGDIDDFVVLEVQTKGLKLRLDPEYFSSSTVDHDTISQYISDVNTGDDMWGAYSPKPIKASAIKKIDWEDL